MPSPGTGDHAVGTCRAIHRGTPSRTAGGFLLRVVGTLAQRTNADKIIDIFVDKTTSSDGMK